MFENWRERKIKGWIKAATWFRYTQYIHLLSTYVPSINPPGLTVLEKSVTKTFNVFMKIGEEEKWRNKGMNKQQQPDSGIHDTSANCPRVYQVTTIQASQFLRNVWRKILMSENWTKKNEEIMGWISSSSLIPIYMIHLPTVHVCTKYQLSRSHNFLEKGDKKF